MPLRAADKQEKRSHKHQQDPRENQWNFIEHNNVNQTRLNRSGLHLTKKGTAALAQNFQ